MLVRAALGASRVQLVAPMLRESVQLCLVSFIVGAGAAYAGLAKLATLRIVAGRVPARALARPPA